MVATPYAHGVTITARRKVRRSPTQLSELMRTSLPRALAMEAMADEKIRARAIARAKIFWWDGRSIWELTARDFASLPIPAVTPVRRLGSFQGARSKIVLHSTRVEGFPSAIMAESKLERHCMVELDRTPGIRAYRAQPFVAVWPVEDAGVICQIPDLAARVGDDLVITSVRPQRLLTDYSQAILAGLMPETFTGVNMRYRLVVDMTPQRIRNVNLLAFLRWKAVVADSDWFKLINVVRPTSMAGVVRCAGGGTTGRGRALLALAQAHFDVDLELPIVMGSEVRWR